MLNKREIVKISRENGINCNDLEQLKKAIDISKFATDSYKELSSKEFYEFGKYLLFALSSANSAKKTSEDELSDFMKYLCESLSSGFEGVKDVAMVTKYKKNLELLKIRFKELYVEEYLKEHSNGDLSSSIDALIMLCRKEVRDAKEATKNTLDLDEVIYSDDQNLYLNGNYGTVSVSKSAYVDARIKTGIKYGANLLGGVTLLGISKILKKPLNQSKVHN